MHIKTISVEKYWVIKILNYHDIMIMLSNYCKCAHCNARVLLPALHQWSSSSASSSSSSSSSPSSSLSWWWGRGAMLEFSHLMLPSRQSKQAADSSWGRFCSLFSSSSPTSPSSSSSTSSHSSHLSHVTCLACYTSAILAKQLENHTDLNFKHLLQSAV